MAIQDRGAGRGFSARAQPHRLAQGGQGTLPRAVLGPAAVVVKDGTLGREVPGQEPPLAAGAVLIEDRIDDGPQGDATGSPRGGRGGQERCQGRPILVGQVTGVVGAVGVHTQVVGAEKLLDRH